MVLMSALRVAEASVLSGDFFIAEGRHDGDAEADLLDNITTEASQTAGVTKIKPFLLYACNRMEEKVGWLSGYVFYGSLVIDILWIKPGYRRQGIGSALVRKAFAVASEKKLQMVTVSTMEWWNALEFYKKLGFRLDFIRGGFENGYRQYHLSKSVKNETSGH